MTEKIKYSEIFKSIQGEGKYTGVPTLWLRLFMCNLNCDGFGQKDPRDPSTYILPYKDVDAKQIKMIEDIPVFEYGCDSSYSWAAKFKNLQYQSTPDEIVDKLVALTDDKRHPSLKITEYNQRYRSPFHLCFTGGEPLLKANQEAVLAVIRSFKDRKPSQFPYHITFETNGTQLVGEALEKEFRAGYIGGFPNKVLFSYSPKLFSVSGEPAKRALKPDIIAANIENTAPWSEYQLKFVLNKDERAWAEMEEFLDRLAVLTGDDYVRDKVYIMPVGADQDAQYQVAGDIADMAVERGYKVSARVHAYLWNNPVGK